MTCPHCGQTAEFHSHRSHTPNSLLGPVRYARAAVASGVSDRRLSELLGHTDGKTSQRYVHLAHSDLYKAAVEATADYISPK